MDVRKIRIEEFDYPLEDHRIARHPLADRESCRLLVADNRGNVTHRRFHELPELIGSDCCMFCNDTRVINARIEMRKATGSRIEIFLLEPVMPEDYVLMFQSRGSCRWSCLVGNRKRWKGGPLVKTLTVGGREVELSATITGEREGNACEVEFRWNDDTVTWASVVEAAGVIPIPPYLKRDSEQCDTEDYQTVYARIQGSVAAPTAGLHFTDRLMRELRDNGVSVNPVTLHVGAGTFQPVKSEDIGGHPMHTETFTVTRDTVEALLAALTQKRRVLAVGTTTVRTLESLPYLGLHLGQGSGNMHVDQWEAYEVPDFDTAQALRNITEYMDKNGQSSVTASTAIMIAPGFRWRLVDTMVTNFHQPQSTLLLLVSSFLGNDGEGNPLWRRYYQEALAGDYRFLSYGDACLFFNNR